MSHTERMEEATQLVRKMSNLSFKNRVILVEKELAERDEIRKCPHCGFLI